MKKSIIALIVLIILGGLGVLGVWLTQTRPLKLVKTEYKNLPGWQKVDMSESLKAFQGSCKTILKLAPGQNAGTPAVPMKARDWRPACEAAIKIQTITPYNAREFFKNWFVPAYFYTNEPVKGLFTGYYMPLFQASKEKTDEFNVPLFGMPKNLIMVNLADFNSDLAPTRVFGRVKNQQLVPYFTRSEINKGAVDEHAPVLAWLKSPIDRLYLEIQGSGILQLRNGRQMIVGYAAQNGAPYTAIGSVLIKRGHLQPEHTSMQTIRHYLETHPDEVNEVLNQNQSFVFFQRLKQNAALGAQGIPLTPGYSLAVDRKYIPLGLPLWLDASHPDQYGNSTQTLQRLMIAQDTGGAIRGAVRGDVYWGPGEKAQEIAGRMKNQGRYWLLLPRQQPLVSYAR